MSVADTPVVSFRIVSPRGDTLRRVIWFAGKGSTRCFPQALCRGVSLYHEAEENEYTGDGPILHQFAEGPDGVLNKRIRPIIWAEIYIQNGSRGQRKSGSRVAVDYEPFERNPDDL